MKRSGGLWDSLVSFGNLVEAARRARKGKRGKHSVLAFDWELESNLIELRDELVAHRYEPGPYRTFLVREAKERLISAAPYRDRVVHHALCAVIEPHFERAFIHDSYACRVGKGQHRAVERLQSFCRRWPFVLKCDIRRFFPSIDHEVLKGLIARKIKDRAVLDLCDKIIAGSNPQGGAATYFPGDDLFAPHLRRRGLPIGNLTSQFLANVYLDPLDHFVKETLRAKGYVRYCDDFVLFGDAPGQLLTWRDRMRGLLDSLRLELHPGKQHIWKARDGIDFLGYRVFPFHKRLRRGNEAGQRRRLVRLMASMRNGEVEAAQVTQSVRSWVSHALHADTYGLRKTVLGGAERHPPLRFG
jgi:retron-type reverse transcriptase